MTIPLPSPISPSRWTLIPQRIRRLCSQRFRDANSKYGDLWASMDELREETIDEIADVINYTEFARARGASRLAVWAVELLCGAQVRLVRRCFGDLPKFGE